MTYDPNADHSNQTIAGIVVHPSGFNVVLRDGPSVWLDVGMVHKGFGLLRQINGSNWGDPDKWAETDTTTFMNGYPIVSYRDSEHGDRAVWDRVRKP